jgi:membrane-associated phospholipid phosphatase
MLARVPTALYFLTLASLAASNPLPAEVLPGPTQAVQAADVPRVNALAFDWTREALVTGVSGALWITSEALLKKELAPKTCRWCDRGPAGEDTLNAVDRWGRSIAANTAEGRRQAARLSDIMGFGVVPLGTLGGQYALFAGSGAPPRYYAQDATIIMETAALAALTNQVVKFAVGRERPFVHVLPEEEKARTERPSDNNLSFYSGHTSLAFSLVTAAGTVSELRGYRNSWLIWAVGLPAAATTGVLRMVADKHYLTDVLVGAAAGSLFGVGVPLLLHGREQPQQLQAAELRVSGGVGGFVLSGRF